MATDTDNKGWTTRPAGGSRTLRPSPHASGYMALRQVAVRRRVEGDLLGALAAYRHAAELARQRRDHRWQGLLLGEMADLYRQKNAPDLAQALYQDALACLVRSGDLDRIESDPPAAAPRWICPTRRASRVRAAWPRALAVAAAGTVFLSMGTVTAEQPPTVALEPAARPVPVEPVSGLSDAPDLTPPGVSEEQRLLVPADPTGDASGTSQGGATGNATASAAPPSDLEPPQGREEPDSFEGSAAQQAASAPSNSQAPTAEEPKRSANPQTVASAAGPDHRPSPPGLPPATPGEFPSRPPPGHSRSLSVPRVASPAVIDGRLDDGCWEAGARADGFWVSETGRPASEATEALVAADSHTLYVAFRCHESQPGTIFGQQTKRDAELGHDDTVTVELDPYHNHRTILSFSVNVLGTQADSLAGNRANKIEWKGDWEGAAARTAEGWTAELAIPFAILNYAAGTDTFGVNFVRYHHRTQETSRWADVTPAFRPEEMGHLTGLRLPSRAARPLSLMTYTTGGLNTADRAGHRHSFLAGTGLDLRYNAANNITGMASLYPDFSQVEDDVLDLSFDYNEKFRTDHRPFFQEGSSFFGDQTYFHSGRVPDFDYGLKSFGKAGPLQFGLLGVQAPGGRRDYVARVLREFGPTMNAGVTVVGTQRSGLQNHLVALDAWGRSRRNWIFNTGVASTFSRGTPGDGTRAGFLVGHESPHWQAGVGLDRTGKGFLPADGFIAGDLLGTQGGGAYLSYGRTYAAGPLRRVDSSVSYSLRETLTGLLQSRKLSLYLGGETRSNTFASFSVAHGPYRPRGEDPGEWASHLNNDRLYSASLFFNSGRDRHSYGLTYSWGALGGHRYSDLSPSFWLKPTRRTYLRYSFERTESFEASTQNVFSLAWEISPEQTLSARWVQFGGQFYRLAYRRQVRRGVDIYAVYNKEPGVHDRFVLKLVRSLR